jgi:hypothetical protein
VQADDPTHDTEANDALVPPLEVETICQEVPCQLSTTDCHVVPLYQAPTAMQADDRTHDTEANDVLVAPPGLGEGTICQEVPSQRSTSDW